MGDVMSSLPGVEKAVEPGSDDDVMKLSKVGIANNLGDKEIEGKSREEIEREEGLEEVWTHDLVLLPSRHACCPLAYCK